MSQAKGRFNQESFQHWISLPQTKLFLSFLRDRQETLGKAWMSGSPMPEVQQCKAMLLGELATLNWADYASFYDIEVEEQPAE